MVDYTLIAVMRQAEAMSCQAYRIGVYDRNSDKMTLKHGVEKDKLAKLTPYLKFENLNGRDIYISCDRSEDRAIILVDDLDRLQLSEMKKRGINPACVTETSPSNHQAWISLGDEPMSAGQKKICARLLAKEFSGDAASTDAFHLGRLAGFTNRKPIHVRDGKPPFVLCLEWTGRHADKSSELREWSAKREALELLNQAATRDDASGRRQHESADRKGHPDIFAIYFRQWETATTASGRTYDLSRGDFAVVCRMVKEGWSLAGIQSQMEQYSPNISERKKNHVDDYISRTIDAALKRVNARDY
jgi:hypothetical protein